MDREKFQIEIESKGEYEIKKEFKKIAQMTEREFIGLVEAILDYIEKLPV